MDKGPTSSTKHNFQIIGYQGFGQNKSFRHRMSWVFLGVSGFFRPVFGSNGNITLFLRDGRCLHITEFGCSGHLCLHTLGDFATKGTQQGLIDLQLFNPKRKQPCSGRKSSPHIICCLSILYILFQNGMILIPFLPAPIFLAP